MSGGGILQILIGVNDAMQSENSEIRGKKLMANLVTLNRTSNIPCNLPVLSVNDHTHLNLVQFNQSIKLMENTF